MATHAREQIRDAIVTLVTGLTTTSTRVHKSRTYNFAQGALPCLNVVCESEELVDELSSPRHTRIADATFVIEGRAQAKSDLDETLDDIAAEVEKAIAADYTLSNKAHFIWYQGADIEMSEEGEKPIGMIRLFFRVRYQTTVADPTAIL